MKKFILALALTLTFVCLLAISVSAAPQNYQSYEVELVSGEKITAYQVGSWDQWQGRILVMDNMYSEAPVDSEGTYATIDWSQIAVLDFTNAWGHIYNSTTGEHELKRGTNGSMHAYSSSFTPSNATSLKKIITGAATLMGGASFKELPALEEVVVDNALTNISWNCFDKCTALKTITIKEGTKLETFGQQAFIRCTALEVFEIPSTVTSIGGNLFDGCTSLKTVVWNSNLTTIPNGTFNGCTSLEFEIPDYITKIGNNAFKNCDAFVKVVIPDGVTEIGNYVFSSCDNLEEIVITDNSLIANKMVGFAEYSPKLKSIRIPPLVTEIGYDNFRGCTSLSEVIWPNNLLKISGGQNFSNTAITKIAFPNTVTYVEGGNFTNLEEMRLGANLTNIGSGLFNYKTLKRVYIPATITTVGKNILGWSNPADSSSNITFIFTGTLEEAEALRALALAATEGTNHQPNSQKFYDSPLVHASEYDVTQEPVGFTFVYEYNLCEAFYDGVHAEGKVINSCQFGCGRECGLAQLLENPQHQLSIYISFGDNGYFSASNVTESCSVCKTVTINEDIAAMFVDYGYSVTEAPINGAYSMSQFYGINREAIEQYRAYSQEFAFGFVVAASADPFGALANGELSADKMFVTTEDLFAYDYVSVRISGISDAIKDKAVAFCMFVNDGEDIYYLDGGETVDAVAMKSYADLISAQK